MVDALSNVLLRMIRTHLLKCSFDSGSNPSASGKRGVGDVARISIDNVERTAIVTTVSQCPPRYALCSLRRLSRNSACKGLKGDEVVALLQLNFSSASRLRAAAP